MASCTTIHHVQGCGCFRPFFEMRGLKAFPSVQLRSAPLEKVKVLRALVLPFFANWIHRVREVSVLLGLCEACRSFGTRLSIISPSRAGDSYPFGSIGLFPLRLFLSLR